jgi:hypothetical protein
MKALTLNLKALALAAGVAACFSANATTAITFDPTATPGPAGNLTITTLDQAPGNALAVGVNQSSNANTAFTLYYQANLQAAQNGSSLVFANGTGGNFFTFVAGFGESIASNTVLSPTQRILTFNFDASNPNNFYRMYATPGAGNDLAGTGFQGASAPILTGHFVATNYSSSFLINGPADPTTNPLDQFGPNNYAATSTVNGSGATAITLVIDSFNANYFPSLVVGATSSLINTSQILAFSQIDPSALFTNQAGGTLAGVSSVGPVNGLGANTQFQADANQAFTVPEPLPTALIGMGLVAMGLARRRSKKS